MSANNIINETLFCAIFCDDIRDETSGKTTIVGAYGADMLLREFPAFVPKLCLYIKSFIVISPFTGNLTIRIERNDEILLENVVPSADLVSEFKARDENQDAPTRRVVDMRLVLGSLQFKKSCTLRAIVELEGKTYIAGKLHVSRKADIFENDLV